MKFALAVAVILYVLFSTMPLFAHHSFVATFDPSNYMTVSVTITKVGFRNPHSIFWGDVKRNGKVENWAFEGGGPAVFRGVEGAMQPGAVVTIKAYPAKDGSRFAAIGTLTTADGRRLVGGAGAPEDTADKTKKK